MHWFYDWLPLGAVPDISPEALNAALKGGRFQLVDVRTALEFKASHIPGAVNLPIGGFSVAAVTALNLDPARPVVAICLTAHRSIPAVRRLREMGFDACHLEGGMRLWWKHRLPTERAGWRFPYYRD